MCKNISSNSCISSFKSDLKIFRTKMAAPIIFSQFIVFGSLMFFFFIDNTHKFYFSESEILEHDESYEPFYMYFCALAANSISGQCSSSKSIEI